MDSIKTRLLTRFEIIELWNNQDEIILNAYCCPNCRDLLFDHADYKNIKHKNYDDFYYCHNEDCANYNLPIERIE